MYGLTTAVYNASKNIKAIWEEQGACTLTRSAISRKCLKLLKDRKTYMWHQWNKTYNGHVPPRNAVSTRKSKRRPDVGRDPSSRGTPSVYRRPIDKNSNPNVNSSVQDNIEATLARTQPNPTDPPPSSKKLEPPGNTIFAQQWLDEFGNDLFDIAPNRQSAITKQAYSAGIFQDDVRSNVAIRRLENAKGAYFREPAGMVTDSLAAMNGLIYKWEVESDGTMIV